MYKIIETSILNVNNDSRFGHRDVRETGFRAEKISFKNTVLS